MLEGRAATLFPELQINLCNSRIPFVSDDVGDQGAPEREVDPAALKGLAHPVRMRLLDEIADRFSATSAQLATALGESRGSTSYHLRQLERHGFLVEDPTRGKGRERYWTRRPGGWTLPAFALADTQAGAAAVDLVLQGSLSADRRRAVAAVRNAPAWPPEWRAATRRREVHVRLTAADTAALIAELDAVIDRYRSAEIRPGARNVSTVFMVTPTEHEAAP